MSHTFLVALKFCSSLQSSLDSEGLEAIYHTICSYVDESNFSLSDFKQAYEAKQHESISDFDVLSLPISFKQALQKSLRSLGGSNNDSSHQLPKLDTSSKPSQREQRIDALRESVSSWEPMFARLQALRGKIRQNSFSDEQNMPISGVGKNKGYTSSDTPDTPKHTADATSSDATRHFSNNTVSLVHNGSSQSTVTQQVQSADAPQPFNNHEEDEYAELVSTRMQQLQDIREQIHAERKNLHELRTIITNSVTTIDDPAIAHFVAQYQKKEDDMQRRELLLKEQQEAMDVSVEHAEKRLYFLKQEENKQKQLLMQLTEQKHELESDIAKIRAQHDEQNHQYQLAKKKYAQISSQIKDAQALYDELHTQAKSLSDEIKVSRDDLVSWEQELEEREQELSKTERTLRDQLQREREAVHHRMKDAEKNYKQKMRHLEEKEYALESQKREIVALKEDIIDVRKTLHRERKETEQRQKELNERFIELERREVAMTNREKSIDSAAQESLSYIEDKKKELYKQTLQEETRIERKLEQIQKKEMDLLRLEQDLVSKKKKLDNNAKHYVEQMPKSMKQQQANIAQESADLHDRIERLSTYEDMIAKQTDTSYQESKRVAQDDAVSKRAQPSFASSQENVTNSANKKNKSVTTSSSSANEPPRPSVSNIPSPQNSSLPLPDDPDDIPTVKEVEALIELAEGELYKDVGVARITYNQLREMYHRMPSRDKKHLFPRLMRLYDALQANSTVMSK